MKLPVLVIAVLYTCLFISLSDQGHVNVYVDWITGKNNRSCWSTGNPCKTLDFACQGLQNNSQIVLLPGFQQLQYDTTLSYFENISIIGQKKSIVNCTDDAGIGLKFFNVTNLSIGKYKHFISKSKYYFTISISCLHHQFNQYIYIKYDFY